MEERGRYELSFVQSLHTRHLMKHLLGTYCVPGLVPEAGFSGTLILEQPSGRRLR